MKRRVLLVILATAAPLLVAGSACATITVNSPMTITRQVTVQLIQTALDNGSTPATAFGNSTQRASIESGLDTIWAQAGIDINVLPTITAWNNTFAYQGVNGAGTRNSNDLDSVFTSAQAAGKLNANTSVLNLILVNVVPAFTPLSENQVAGYARVSGNGIMGYVGDNLLGFQDGLDVVSAVMSHEIGHNLGLDHTANGSDNLMAGSNGTSQRLDAGQISTARSSVYAPLYTPTQLAGDYNNDGKVNAADYVVWRNNNSVGTYATWKANFGKTAGSGASGDVLTLGSVPEPGTLTFVLIALSTYLAFGRKRGR